MKLVVVTGLSGSGKSVALHALEDTGFFCIDNLPVGLVEALTDELLSHRLPQHDRVALGIDARNPALDLAGMPQIIERVKDQGVDVRVLFLEADDPILLQRFSETRRRHPLAAGTRTLEQAIQAEHELLAPFRGVADFVLDTSRTNLHQLRELIRQRIAETAGKLSISLQSFGYKHGIPQDADLIFDARCLPNPHWHTHLRPLSGRDAPVQDFLTGEQRTERLYDQIAGFVDDWLPCLEQDARSYLTVAIGCTGGQHRSVYLVERLAEHLRALGHEPLVIHRELP
jgi:UPF0042 nucleotide-binding protein